MRVIAGKFKNLRLLSAGASVRPVMDQVKEYIFNVIKDRIPGSRVCDLFAGSGSLGIEALSRGATHATFVDSSAAAIDSIQKNIERLDIADLSTVLRMEVEQFILRSPGPFDLVFCDPPYRFSKTAKMTEGIIGRRIVKENGVLIIEHQAEANLIETILHFRRLRLKNFGRTLISLYSADPSPPGPKIRN